MTLEQYEQAKAIRDRIQDLEYNINQLESYRIHFIQLNDASTLKELPRGAIKETLKIYYSQKINDLETRFHAL